MRSWVIPPLTCQQTALSSSRSSPIRLASRRTGTAGCTAPRRCVKGGGPQPHAPAAGGGEPGVLDLTTQLHATSSWLTGDIHTHAHLPPPPPLQSYWRNVKERPLFVLLPPVLTFIVLCSLSVAGVMLGADEFESEARSRAESAAMDWVRATAVAHEQLAVQPADA